jgi:hypothetical protein
VNYGQVGLTPTCCINQLNKEIVMSKPVNHLKAIGNGIAEAGAVAFGTFLLVKRAVRNHCIPAAEAYIAKAKAAVNEAAKEGK